MYLAYLASLQALHSKTLKQIIQIQLNNRITNPNQQEASSWLFTSMAERELGTDREQIQLVARAGLEPGTAGLRVREKLES